MKELLDLPSGNKPNVDIVQKIPMELPQGSGKRKYVVVPKNPIELPQGESKQEGVFIQKHPIELPQGNDKRSVSVAQKTALQLPQGEGAPRLIPVQKESIQLPQGDNSPKINILKKGLFELPQQEDMEPMAGGIGGLHDNISPTNRPLNLLSVCRNMRRFGVTGAQTRPGRTILGDQVGTTRILGMSAYYTASLEKLIAQSGTTLKVYNTTSKEWDTLKSGMKDAPFQAVTFNDLHIITNGTDNVQKYDGTEISDLGGSPQKGKFIATAYQRVFISGVSGSPHLLYVSDIADAEEWTEGDSGAVPINDKDGDEIKWAMIYKSNMVIWKRYGIFELHGPELGYTTDDWSVAPIAAIGTPNGRTIADVNGFLYWLSDSENSKGIVRWGGGRPVLISEPVEDTVASINYSAIATACAISSGEGEYLLAVPTGESQYPDTVIVYNANDNSWWVWDGWKPTAFLPFRLIGDTSSLLMGDNDGYVYVMGGQIDEEPEA